MRRHKLTIVLALSLCLTLSFIALYHANTKALMQEKAELLNELDSLKTVIQKQEETIEKKDENIEELISLKPMLEIISWQNDTLQTYIKIEIARAIMRESTRYHQDMWKIAAMIVVESAYDPNAVSSAGALGLMQVKPGTAEYVCNYLNLCWDGPERLFDWEYNIKIGCAYLYILRYMPKHLHTEAYGLGPAGIDDNNLWYTGLVKRSYSYLKAKFDKDNTI